VREPALNPCAAVVYHGQPPGARLVLPAPSPLVTGACYFFPPSTRWRHRRTLITSNRSPARNVRITACA
jgi:hypothetical protein